MPEMPRWLVMWLIAGTLFAGLKLLSWRRLPAPWWKHVAYLLLWPGMDAMSFLTGPGQRPTVREWAFVFGKMAFGLLVLCLTIALIDRWPAELAGWIGMVGIIFTLHFGLFHVLSCFCRSFGCDAKPIMNWPILSISLAEFWGKRWNLAFRDLTHEFLFRPGTKRLGVVGATAIGFFVSGLIHELAITVPAGGGYGGPTAYFIIQLVGLLVERSRIGKPIRGRAFTWLCLIAPAYWLFPPPFTTGIVVPFVRFVGGMT
jgi:hypothetical protein